MVVKGNCSGCCIDAQDVLDAKFSPEINEETSPTTLQTSNLTRLLRDPT